MGFQAVLQGDLQQAIPVLERALALAQGTHIRLGVLRVAAPLGTAYVLAGRTTEALPLLAQAVEQAVAVRFLLDYALQVVWLGEAYLRAGRLDDAITQAQRALEFARAHQEPGYEAYALRLLGEIAAQCEPPEATPAEVHYQQALALAKTLGMHPLQAHCHRGLGTLYSAQDRPPLARDELSAAMALYQAMDMTFWLPQVKAALARVRLGPAPQAG
jgi:tetratricopeptide (TPR) repeat protein